MVAEVKALGRYRHICTTNVPTRTIPTICLVVSGSSKKTQANIAICGNIVLFKMLDSTAVSVCNVVFHKVNANAESTTAAKQ